MAHDKSQPNSNFLILIGGASTVILFITLCFSIVHFQQVATRTQYDNIESKVSLPLVELRAVENAKLMKYDWVDRDARIVRIPIEDAILLESKESWRKNVQVSQDTPIPEVTQNKPSGL